MHRSTNKVFVNFLLQVTPQSMKDQFYLRTSLMTNLVHAHVRRVTTGADARLRCCLNILNFLSHKTRLIYSYIINESDNPCRFYIRLSILTKNQTACHLAAHYPTRLLAYYYFELSENFNEVFFTYIPTLNKSSSYINNAILIYICKKTTCYAPNSHT